MIGDEHVVRIGYQQAKQVDGSEAKIWIIIESWRMMASLISIL
jgi:hypothetical protein